MRHQPIMGTIMVKLEVVCQWDEKSQLWFVVESNVPGLSAEAPSKDEMVRVLDVIIPELMQLNSDDSSEDVPLELLFRKDQASLAHC